MIGLNVGIVLLITVAVAFYDARNSERNGSLVLALKSANADLVERTRRSEQLTLELR